MLIVVLNDGKGQCDNCGHIEENAGIVHFLLVADLDPARPGIVENLHFCRAKKCDKRVRRDVILKTYHEVKEKEATTK